MRKLILIIDHFDSFSHNLYQAVAQIQESKVIRCNELELEDLPKLNPSLIILSPGPRGPEDTGITLPLLRSEFGQNQPILGICLGFQAMGLHWGAEVQKAPEVVHGKTLNLHPKTHPIFKDCEHPLQVARYHSLCVKTETLPPNIDILSEHQGMAMAVEDQTRPWMGLQFHPESFLTTCGPKLLTNIAQYYRISPPTSRYRV